MNKPKFNPEKSSDPKYWKLGLFYFNKNDNRIFPPKRIKQLGWTVNFANPISIIIMIAIVVLIYMLGNYSIAK